MSSKYTIKFLPNVEQELGEIFDHITNVLCNPSATEKLADDIDRAISYMETDPEIYPMSIINGIRKCAIRNFLIFYEVYHDAKKVLVLHICHGSQDYKEYFNE